MSMRQPRKVAAVPMPWIPIDTIVIHMLVPRKSRYSDCYKGKSRERYSKINRSID